MSRNPDDSISRRRFLAALPAAAAGLALARPDRLVARTFPSDWEHPDPRPGVDGSTVLTADDLVDAPHVVEIYDGIREAAHIADGIRCHCGCADLPRTRSLLSCYEEGGMARYCEICQGEGRLVSSRFREGQSLDQIRRAIDARYGPRGAADEAALAAHHAEVMARARADGRHGHHADVLPGASEDGRHGTHPARGHR